MRSEEWICGAQNSSEQWPANDPRELEYFKQKSTRVNMPDISIAALASMVPRKGDDLKAFNGWDLFIASELLGSTMQISDSTLFWTYIDRGLSKNGVQQWIINNTSSWRVLQSNRKWMTVQKYRYTNQAPRRTIVGGWVRASEQRSCYAAEGSVTILEGWSRISIVHVTYFVCLLLAWTHQQQPTVR